MAQLFPGKGGWVRPNYPAYKETLAPHSGGGELAGATHSFGVIDYRIAEGASYIVEKDSPTAAATATAAATTASVTAGVRHKVEQQGSAAAGVRHEAEE